MRRLPYTLPDWADTPTEADLVADAVDDYLDDLADQRRDAEADDTLRERVR